MLQIKDLNTMTLDEKISYISKIQKELAVYKAQIEEVKNELKTLYPQGTPSTCVGYKVTVNYEFPVFETTKTKIGTKIHSTVTIK